MSERVRNLYKGRGGGGKEIEYWLVKNEKGRTMDMDGRSISSVGKSENIKRDFYSDVYTILNRI